MERNKLKPLSQMEKSMAEANHDLVYRFLHRNKYRIEDYYNVVIFGYLKAVQDYCREKETRNKYSLEALMWLYMRAEVSNYHRMQNAAKRKPVEKVLSLDAEYTEMETLLNLIGGKSAEDDVLERENIKELLENLTDNQRKIVLSVMNGYSNTETFLMIGMPSSSYYKEKERIREAVKELLF